MAITFNSAFKSSRCYANGTFNNYGTYPITFSEAPSVELMFQTRNGSAALLWPFSANASTAQYYLPQCYLIRPTTASGINGNINIYAKGKI